MNKEFSLEIKAGVKINGKVVSGNMLILFEPPEDKKESREHAQKNFDHSMDQLKRKIGMTWLNGWAMQDDTGELECVFCLNRTIGFNWGKYSKDAPRFDPFSTPCPCRLPS